MIKQSVIVITIAYAAHLYFQQATNTLVNTTVLLPSEPHPELNWYLTSGSAVTSTNAPATTPLVTIENILPSKLLSAALSEIQSSITTTTMTPNKDSPYLKQSCTLARDGGACGD